MSVVAASVVPHSPLLLPSIAKQHAGLFTQTTKSLVGLAADWYAAKPDVVIVLSPHGIPKKHDLIIHSAETFSADFDEFGDMATKLTAVGAIGVMHHLKTAGEREHLPLHMQTLSKLDYGTSVPLSFLLSAQPDLPVCSILIGTRQPDQLIRLASVLREFTTSGRQRFLVLASCDMTRRQEHHPDMHRRPTAEERAYSSAIVEVDPARMSAAAQSTTCGYSPLFVLITMLNGLADHGRVLTFEAPLGVGLLTATFSFNS